MRYAIYFTPPPGDALTKAAEAWLGRSAFTDTSWPVPADRETLIGSPRRYGFHGTLKAPFRLAEGRSEAELLVAFRSWAAARSGFLGPRLVIGEIDGFFALIPELPHMLLHQLARDAVRDFEAFRAPLSQDDMARRNPTRLSANQRARLATYGYPYVLDEFRFHMTLTERVASADAPAVRRSLERHFAPLLEKPIVIGSIALFAEQEAGGPFVVCSLRELPQQSSVKAS